MSFIYNPILPGFNPDPSIIYDGDYYVIATSTFEWFPGVQIHRSKDLMNWELVGHALTRKSQLDMRGVPDSCGVWAPCLTFDNGTYYLVFSNVQSFKGVWKDTPNFLVTTKDLTKGWSDPVFLDSKGFDGSLFHDDDGQKYYLSMEVNHRGKDMFGDILLQRFDLENKKLTGPVSRIFAGTSLGLTEGPHIYQRNDYYYLITAEGGTEYGHAATIARSKSVSGPYEVHPDNPFISTSEHPEHPFQKTGHADLLRLPNDEWWVVFLMARPNPISRRCILGRETALNRVIWKNDWPYLSSESRLPVVVERVHNNSSEICMPDPVKKHITFDSNQIDKNFQSLRVPMDGWLTPNQSGKLKMLGRQSLSSLLDQSLLAHRIQHSEVKVSTRLDFDSEGVHQMAGLVFYYNSGHYHYLHVTANTEGQQELNIISVDNVYQTQPLKPAIRLKSGIGLELCGILKGEELQFYYAEAGEELREVGPILDASILSDDYVQSGGDLYQPAFTGAFAGMCAQDLTGKMKPAYFDFFDYEEIIDQNKVSENILVNYENR